MTIEESLTRETARATDAWEGDNPSKIRYYNDAWFILAKVAVRCLIAITVHLIQKED